MEKTISKNEIKGGNIIKATIALIGGAFAGVVNGFFGGGGGIVLVPILSGLFKLEQKKAQATAMSIALPLCVISGIIYTLRGATDWTLLLSVGGGVVLGGILGAVILKKLSNNALCFVFYALMIAAGIKMLV